MANIQFPTAYELKVASIWNEHQALVQEGSVYMASNPTPGTGILGTICVDDVATASSTHAQFAPFLLVTNGWSAANPAAKTIYPLYIRLTTTVASANATDWSINLRLDNTATKYVSGGSSLTPVNLNSAVNNASGATVYAGAIVPSGVVSSAGRLLSRNKVSPVIPLFGDTHILTFGDSAMDTNMLMGGATARCITLPCAPTAIAPGWCMQLDQYGTSSLTTAGQWEVELVYAER